MMDNKEFSSFDVAAVIKELRNRILDSRVDNIYQQKKILLLKLRKTDSKDFMIIEAGRRIHLTRYTFDKPKIPPGFCMALRKHLRGARLISIEQHDFERSVILSFKTKNGNRRLYVELFGDGNIILTDEQDRILNVLSHRRMRDRDVIPGETFRFAPPRGQNPLEIQERELLESLKSLSKLEAVRAIARLISIGGLYAEEILKRAGIPKKIQCSQLRNEMVEKALQELKKLAVEASSGHLEPCIVLDENGAFVDAVPIRLNSYDEYEHRCHNNFNETLDEFYTTVDTVKRTYEPISDQLQDFRSESERLMRIISKQEKALLENQSKADRYKRVGDAIYKYNSELQALSTLIQKKMEQPQTQDTAQDRILEEADESLCIRLKSSDPERSIIRISLEELEFELNFKKSLFANAGRYYEMSKQAKRKMKGAKSSLDETRAQLAEVRDKIAEIERSGKPEAETVLTDIAKRKIRRKKWFEKFRWFISSDGFLVVGGKDAVSNEVLIKKHAEDGDLVFHADVAGAPFVIVKADGKRPNDQCLVEASEFAAAYSRGWREGFASVDVYWVNPSQLSKGPPSGQYVPRGGFLVYGKRNWIRGARLRVGIGVIKEEEEFRFLCGPLQTVKAKTGFHVTIIPGKMKGKTLAQHVFRILAAKSPEKLRKEILAAQADEITRCVPYGTGHVLTD